jgi:hypothetical protein
MNKLLQALKSRTVYTIVILALFNGLQAIQPVVSGKVAITVNSVLGILAILMKLFPSQNYEVPPTPQSNP